MLRRFGAGGLLVRRAVRGPGGRAAPGVPRGGRRRARAAPAPARARGGPARLPRRRRAARAVQALVQGASRPPQAGPSRSRPLLPVALRMLAVVYMPQPACLTESSGWLAGWLAMLSALMVQFFLVFC